MHITCEASRAYRHTCAGTREQRSISTKFLTLEDMCQIKEMHARASVHAHACTNIHTHSHVHTHNTSTHTHRATARAARPAALTHLFLHVKFGAGCDQLGYCLHVTVLACDHQRRPPLLQRQQTARRASDATPPVTGARVSLDRAVVPCSSGAHTYMYIHKRMPVCRNEYLRT